MDSWKDIARLTKQEIINLQNNKLQQFISAHVYPFSPYYKKLFDDHKIDPNSIRTREDLAKIPFTSKLDFVYEDQSPRFKDFILQPDKDKIKKYWPKLKLISMMVNSIFKGKAFVQDSLAREYRPVFMTFTTGTTNKPVPFTYSNYDIKNLHVSGDRMLGLFDLDPEDKLVNMFPFAPHLAFWQVVFGGLAGNILTLSTGGGKSIGTEGNIAAIEKIQPSTILGVPSYVYHVLREAADRGCKMPYVKKVVLGASKVTISFKQKLAELLHDMGAQDVCVLGTYGFTEARAAWGECPTSLDVSSGYHLYPDKEIFEIVDPKTGQSKGEGEDGEIVYTSIDSRASALIRYRTGDYCQGGITYEPCPHCGRRMPRLSSNISRLSDVKDLQLSKVKGTLINFNNFAATLSECGDVDEWQIEIRKKNNDPFEVDEMTVYVYAKECKDEEKLREEIKSKMVSCMEVAPNDVKVVSKEEIVKRLELETANKEKRILDNRPKE